MAVKTHRLFPPGKRLQKMKLADAALFGSSWWPYASFEDLCVVTHLSTWLFAWDDGKQSAIMQFQLQSVLMLNRA
jgi:hypothetical protein